MSYYNLLSFILTGEKISTICSLKAVEGEIGANGLGYAKIVLSGKRKSRQLIHRKKVFGDFADLQIGFGKMQHPPA